MGSEVTVGNGDLTHPDRLPAVSPDTALMQPSLGKKLQALRLSRGLSLSEVAETSGLSKSFVAVVEQGRSDIAIGRLMRLMQAYGARIADLDATSQGNEQVVVRDGQGRRVRSETGVDLYLLTADTNRAMMPVTTVFAPRARLANLAPHDGETFVYVLEGTLLLELEGYPPKVLSAGDSTYYFPDPPPVLTNLGEVPLRILGVVTPPTF